MIPLNKLVDPKLVIRVTMQKFKEYATILDVLGSLPAFHVENHFPWAKSFVLPNYELDLPSIRREARIQILQHKRTPIYMQLSDGSKLFFTLDEFKRIAGKPEVGKTLRYEMLRLANDQSPAPSMIKSCVVI